VSPYNKRGKGMDLKRLCLKFGSGEINEETFLYFLYGHLARQEDAVKHIVAIIDAERKDSAEIVTALTTVSSMYMCMTDGSPDEAQNKHHLNTCFEKAIECFKKYDIDPHFKIKNFEEK
jgi:hypothetical protein